MLSPASAGDWKRALLVPGLHPFHPAGFAPIVTVRVAQNADGRGPAIVSRVPRYEATAIRSSRLMTKATDIIAPESSARRIRAAGIFCNTSRCGMRSVCCSWQTEQRF